MTQVMLPLLLSRILRYPHHPHLDVSGSPSLWQLRGSLLLVRVYKTPRPGRSFLVYSEHGKTVREVGQWKVLTMSGALLKYF